MTLTPNKSPLRTFQVDWMPDMAITALAEVLYHNLLKVPLE